MTGAAGRFLRWGGGLAVLLLVSGCFYFSENAGGPDPASTLEVYCRGEYGDLPAGHADIPEGCEPFLFPDASTAVPSDAGVPADSGARSDAADAG